MILRATGRTERMSSIRRLAASRVKETFSPPDMNMSLMPARASVDGPRPTPGRDVL
ncbi:hypothetical protein Ae505Ps2_6268 [Pseudonocardia sp. Ae505_Ps2]|nr:hypothetical protein Ae505Ps2_6268 [Pseudonocardia sp. Ae505_Ps2]